jgi:hypothetical protein
MHLKQKEADNQKMLRLQSKVVDKIQKAVEAGAATAGDTDIFVRDLQEQFLINTSDLKETINGTLSNVLGELQAIKTKLENSDSSRSGSERK